MRSPKLEQQVDASPWGRVALKKKLCLCVCLVALPVATACGGERDGHGAQGTTGSAVRFGWFGADPGRPVELVPPSVDDLVFLGEAEEALVEDCMEAAGFEYVPNKVEPTNVRDEMDIGLLSPGYLRAYGYGSQLDDATRRGTDPKDVGVGPNDAITASLSPSERRRWSERLFGPDSVERRTINVPGAGKVSRPTEGCGAEAMIAIYGSIDAALNFEVAGQAVAVAAAQRLRDDPEYVAVVTEWYGCMKEMGYDPQGAPNGSRLAWRAYHDMDQASARQEEMNIASVDADCQERVGVPDVQERVRSALLEESAKEMGFDLMGWQELRSQAVARAREVVVGG